MLPTAETAAQFAALAQGVGVAVLHRTLIAVTGPDRVGLLHSFTTNDVKKLAPGRGCEAFITSPQGKTLGHGYFFCEANRHVMDTTADQAAAIIAHFQKFVITEEVEFIDRSAEDAILLLAGPHAAALLEQSFGLPPPSERLGHVQASVQGNPITIRRVDYVGPDSYFLQIQRAQMDAILLTLLAAGAMQCDEPAVESVRIERGFPLFGLDITPDNLPQEVARDALAISFTKGCYLGQETVARIDAVGHVNRLLVRLKLAGSELPPTGLPLFAAEQQVGHITSSAFSAKFGCPLALGYVRRSYAKPGSMLSSAAGTAEALS